VNVAGWVRNLTDGSVEAVLEGEEESVRRVVDWARRGPPAARVDSLEVESVAPKDLSGFEITG
jgi:acylphosphatase